MASITINGLSSFLSSRNRGENPSAPSYRLSLTDGTTIAVKLSAPCDDMTPEGILSVAEEHGGEVSFKVPAALVEGDNVKKQNVSQKAELPGASLARLIRARFNGTEADAPEADDKAPKRRAVKPAAAE